MGEVQQKFEGDEPVTLVYEFWLELEAELVVPLEEVQRFETTLEPELTQGPQARLGWRVKKPVRWRGYNRPLYDLLKAAQDNGLSVPSSADVLERWADSPPTGYGIKVSPKRLKFSYRGEGKQPEPSADAQAISKAIARMVEVEPGK